MALPKPVFDPPFNIVRASYAVLGVSDLGRARAFYEAMLGLHVEDDDRDFLYLRGLEERQHHSLVLRKVLAPMAEGIGFNVASEDDLDRAAHLFKSRGLRHAFEDRPYQGRTLRALDPLGVPLELYCTMERRENLLQKYGLYRGVHPQRLDHFNVFSPDVQGSLAFYASLGFRLTEYAQEDRPNGRIAAAWLHRKGNVHDVAFTNGIGPRLHHLGYWAPSAMQIIQLCDVMASTGYLATWNADRAGTASPTLSSFTSAARTATASRSTPRTTRPWTPITSRSAGA